MRRLAFLAMSLRTLAAFFVFAGLLISRSVALDATWRSELYPEQGWNPEAARFDRDKVVQDFSYAGYRRGEVPIPRIAGPVYAVTSAPYLADPSGERDATAAIQAAINAAGRAGGGVVFLPAGTYRVSVASDANEALLIERPGVILRGAGTERTFLLNTTTVLRTPDRPSPSRTVIRVRGPFEAKLSAPARTKTPVTTDLVSPTRVIPVADTKPFQLNQIVVVRAALTDEWFRETGEPRWMGQASALGTYLAFRRTVVAVDPAASTVTVDVPLRYALLRRDGAHVALLPADPVAEIGLEDFSIGSIEHPGTEWGNRDFMQPGMPAYDIHASSLIQIERARDSWVRGVHSFQAPGNRSTAHMPSNGLVLRESSHLTIEDCRFERPQYGGAGGNGYMFTIERSQECLFLRNEARFSRHGFSFKGMGCSGNVLHACVDAETGYATGASGRMDTRGRTSDFHMWFSISNLVDSCLADGSRYEAAYRAGENPPHGIVTAHTVFWNISGTDRITKVTPAESHVVIRSDQGRYGYVIGTSGSRSLVDTTQGVPGPDGPGGPVDHVEGEGKGQTLLPASLFIDQRRRRLGPSAPALP